MRKTTPEEIARLAPWFHNLHLPDGSQTNPSHALGDFPRYKWEQIAPAYLRQARWAASVHGLDERIQFHQMAIYQLAQWNKKFDLIWFMGVLYHLRYPLLALDIVRQRAKGLMVFQTLTAPGDQVFK